MAVSTDSCAAASTTPSKPTSTHTRQRTLTSLNKRNRLSHPYVASGPPSCASAHLVGDFFERALKLDHSHGAYSTWRRPGSGPGFIDDSERRKTLCGARSLSANSVYHARTGRGSDRANRFISKCLEERPDGATASAPHSFRAVRRGPRVAGVRPKPEQPERHAGRGMAGLWWRRAQPALLAARSDRQRHGQEPAGRLDLEI